MVDNPVAEIACKNFPFRRLEGNKANAGADFVFFIFNLLVELKKLRLIIYLKLQRIYGVALILAGIIVSLE